MKKPPILLGLLVGLLLTIPLTAVLFAASQLASVPFPAFDLFDLLARTLRGDILTFGIDLMVDTIRALNLGPTDDTAKLAEQLMAVAQFVVLAVAAGTIYFAVVRSVLKEQVTLRRDSLFSGLILGLAFGIPVVLIVADVNRTATAPPFVSVIWLLLAFSAWGLAHGFIYGQLVVIPQKNDEPAVKVLDRRQFLVQLGGAAATITVVGAGLGALLSRSQNSTPTVTSGSNGTIGSGGVTTARLPNADDPVQAAPGTRSEYTPLAEHYRIDINTGGPPAVDLENYTLQIDGLVENPVQLTLDEIRGNWESMSQYITMSCISNRIAGDLISTILWTGVSMQRILELVRPMENATHIHIFAADGFDEIVALDVIRADERVMLTYDWDNQPLPVRHGSPLRIHVPDHYGMKQPKWITRMEFIDSWQEGYWVRRGWDAEARVRATSVIDTVAVDNLVQQGSDFYVPIGGIAWAGARGISRVEVRVDEGEWVEAQLRSPLSDKTWVIWRYDWLFQEGTHRFEVRCVELDGTPQIEDVNSVRPSGATGIHSFQARLNQPESSS